MNTYESTTFLPSGRCRISPVHRLHIRVTDRRHILLDFAARNLRGVSEICGEVRRRAAGYAGLVDIIIRNLSTGETISRRLRLYPPGWNAPCPPTPAAASRTPRCNLGPWDTH